MSYWTRRLLYGVLGNWNLVGIVIGYLPRYSCDLVTLRDHFVIMPLRVYYKFVRTDVLQFRIPGALAFAFHALPKSGGAAALRVRSSSISHGRDHGRFVHDPQQEGPSRGPGPSGQREQYVLPLDYPMDLVRGHVQLSIEVVN
jgi:hypothetical protein